MRVISKEDNIVCAYCGADLTGLAYEQVHTRMDYDFCTYECMENYYSAGVPEGEDFICVAQ